MAIQRRNPMDELTRWRPFRDLEDFTERMGQVFGNLGRFEETRLGLADWAPSVDITETDGEYLITAELPGVKKADVHVTTEEGHLILKGERKEAHEEKGKKIHRIERSYGSFYRILRRAARGGPEEDCRRVQGRRPPRPPAQGREGRGEGQGDRRQLTRPVARPG